MTAPIFIVGANRSGTTLVRLILNAHPRIGVPEEVNYFSPWMAEHWRETASNEDKFRNRVKWQLQHCIEPQVFPGIDRDTLTDEVVKRASTYDWRAVYKGALEAWAAHHGNERWGEKTPGNLFYVDTLRAMFPDAQFIHVVRDPRAGVQSMKEISFFGEDVAFNALIRRKCLREGLAYDKRMPPGRWRRLRYEDLLATPEDTIAALCDFLGEEFHPCMLNYHNDAEQYMKSGAASDFNKAARRPIDPNKIWSWRRKMNSEETAIVEIVCRREMKFLGYTPDATRLPFYQRMWLAVKSLYWWILCKRHDGPGYVIVDHLFESSLRRIDRLYQKATNRAMAFFTYFTRHT